MSRRIDRRHYADLYGPTTGDRVRLGDTALIAQVERDLTSYGDECKFGGGKVLRDGQGQKAGATDAQALSRYQHLQPQRLRALVESAIAHLERARVRDAVANHVHDELRPGELFEIDGAGARHEKLSSCLAARWRADDAGV